MKKMDPEVEICIFYTWIKLVKEKTLPGMEGHKTNQYNPFYEKTSYTV